MTGNQSTNEMSPSLASSARTPGYGAALVTLAALAALVLALFVLAGPAESATTDTVVAKKAEAHSLASSHRKQLLNVVYCPTGGSVYLCAGTGAADALIGRDGEYDQMQGGEDDDTYDGKGGCDALEDASLTSNDRYLVTVKDFCNVGISWLSIRDGGGNRDVLDLGGLYKSSDFTFSRGYTNLYLDGPGLNDISVDDFFTTGPEARDSVDTFKFADKTLSARQVRDMIP